MASINFENFKSGVEVDISQRNDLSSDDLTRILKAVSKNNQVQMINLSNQKFTPVEILLNFLNENLSTLKNLKEIRLENCFSSLDLNQINDSELKMLVSLYKNPNFRKIIFDKSTNQLINTLAMQALPIHSPEEIESDKNTLIEVIPNFNDPNFNFDSIDPSLYDELAAVIWNEDEEPNPSNDPVIPPPEPNEQPPSRQEDYVEGYYIGEGAFDQDIEEGDEEYSMDEFKEYLEVDKQKADTSLDSTESEESLDKFANEFINSLVRRKKADVGSNELSKKEPEANAAEETSEFVVQWAEENHEESTENLLNTTAPFTIHYANETEEKKSDLNPSPEMQPKNVGSSSANKEKYPEKNYQPTINTEDEKKLRQYLDACRDYIHDLKKTISEHRKKDRNHHHTAEKRLVLLQNLVETTTKKKLTLEQFEDEYRKVKNKFPQYLAKENTRTVNADELDFYKGMKDDKAIRHMKASRITHTSVTHKNERSIGKKAQEQLDREQKESQRTRLAYGKLSTGSGLFKQKDSSKDHYPHSQSKHKAHAPAHKKKHK